MTKSNTTQNTGASVPEFLSGITLAEKRADCEQLASMMTELSGEPPYLVGNIVGFGEYHYKYESGREGDSMRTGFAPRAQNISVYIMPGFEPFSDELTKLGKHKVGKSCLYIKRLSDIDVDVLRNIIKKSLDIMAEKYPQ